jgi:hypothetical protein
MMPNSPVPKPKDALDFLRRKKIVPVERWDDISGAEHANAFTASHVTNTEALESIRESIVKAIDDGVPYEKFRSGFLDMLQKKGWYLNPEKAGDEEYTDWRIGVIHGTNMRTAYSAGRYRQQLRISGLRPYLVYKQIQRPTKRTTHEPLHNTALRSDDPFWDKYTPPNDWGCECYTISISSQQYDKGNYKKAVSPNFNEGSVPPEWRHNPGKEALAPDFSQFSNLRTYTDSSGKSALGGIVDAYRKEMSELQLTKGEWNAVEKHLLETETVKKRNPATGILETIEDFKAPKQGIQYFAGSLNPAAADAVGVSETKLMFSDQAIQHGRRWAKIKSNPDQVLPLNEISRLPEFFSSPDDIYFDSKDQTYLFLKNYSGKSESGSVIKDGVIKGVFRKTGASQAWQLISYLIVPRSNVIGELGISKLFPK